MGVPLKDQFLSGEIVLAPGVFDALTGLLVEQAGFGAAYVSGAGIAYSRLGRPDIGLMGLREIADQVTAISERLTIPLIVDGDNGHGNALSVIRTVREYERAGAAALQLEDQALPKRCGHLKGKALVSADEMVGKLHAALDARDDMLIIARCDAIAVEGFEAAIDRAERYVEAGADMLFVEAPENLQQMQEITRRFKGRVPLMANMVEGGSTPITSAPDLQDIGYSLVIFPGGTARALIPALQGYFASLKEHGTTGPWRDRMLDLTGINQVVGTPETLALGARYDASNHTPTPRKKTGTDGQP